MSEKSNNLFWGRRNHMEFGEIIRINNLFDYGVKYSIINKLIEYNITLDKIKTSDIELIVQMADYHISSYHVNKISRILAKKGDEVYKECSVHILDYLGLSKGLVRNLKNNNITMIDLSSCNDEQMKIKYGFNQSTVKKIDNVLDKFFEEATKINNKELIVKEICEARQKVVEQKNRKYICEFCANNIMQVLSNTKEPLDLFVLSKQLNTPMDDLNKAITYLIKAKKIEATSLGFSVVRISLEEYLESINENPKIDIIKMKLLQGKTLQEIGMKYNVSRERIRQIVSKEIDKFPLLNEDIHYKIYTNCRITRKNYYKLFGYCPVEYNYLSTKYKSGKREITETDLKLEKLTQQEIDNYLYPDKDKTSIKYYNEIKKIVEEQNDYFSKESIYQLFIAEYPESNLSERNFEAKMERLDFIVNSGRNGFRYFDMDKLIDGNFLLRIDLSNYKYKCVSSLKIFKDYIVVMNDYGIKNEYELHNILRYFYENGLLNYEYICFKRMPIIEFNSVTKEAIMSQTIKNFYGKTIDDYLEYLYEEYGFRKDTFGTILSSSYSRYIEDGKIIAYDSLSLEEINRLKSILVDDFYSLKDFQSKVESMGMPFNKMTQYNTKMIGYKKYEKYYLSLKYSTLKEYFTSIISQKDVFDKNDFLDFWNNMTFNGVLNKLKSNLDIFEYQPNHYISYRRLNERIGVTKENLINLKNQLKNMFSKTIFFTMKYAYKNGYKDVFQDYDFKDCFYKGMFIYDNDVQMVSVNGTILFGITDQSISVNNLIEDILRKEKSISRYNLNHVLIEDYGIELELFELKNAMHHFNGYYCDVMDKFYITYDLFLEEI
ncbi:hypothetical protein E0K96_03945 [Massilimicrobiota sp. SW1139]|nr:hypothetical protein [Massilimicrobiota sp. SW1139]